MAQTPAERRKAQRANAKALKAGGSRIAGMGKKSAAQGVRNAAVTMGIDLSKGSAHKSGRVAPDRANDSHRVISFFNRSQPKHGKNVASHAGADSDNKNTSYVGKRRSGETKVGTVGFGAHRAA